MPTCLSIIPPLPLLNAFLPTKLISISKKEEFTVKIYKDEYLMFELLLLLYRADSQI